MMKYLFMFLFIFLFCCKQKEKSDNVPNFCLEVTRNNYACLYVYTDNVVYYPPGGIENDSLYLETFSTLIKNIDKKNSCINKIYFNTENEMSKKMLLEIKNECSLYFSKDVKIEYLDAEQIIFDLISN